MEKQSLSEFLETSTKGPSIFNRFKRIKPSSNSLRKLRPRSTAFRTTSPQPKSDIQVLAEFIRTTGPDDFLFPTVPKRKSSADGKIDVKPLRSESRRMAPELIKEEYEETLKSVETETTVDEIFEKELPLELKCSMAQTEDVKGKKKSVRHAYLQTLQPRKLSASTQVNFEGTELKDKSDNELKNENTALREQVEQLNQTLELEAKANDYVVENMEYNRQKFDQLSAAAYKKLKQLINENDLLSQKVEELSLKLKSKKV